MKYFKLFKTFISRIKSKFKNIPFALLLEKESEVPLGSVRKSIWDANLSEAVLSSNCGARIFFARTVTLYIVLGTRPGTEYRILIHLFTLGRFVCHQKFI